MLPLQCCSLHGAACRTDVITIKGNSTSETIEVNNERKQLGTAGKAMYSGTNTCPSTALGSEDESQISKVEWPVMSSLKKMN